MTIERSQDAATAGAANSAANDNSQRDLRELWRRGLTLALVSTAMALPAVWALSWTGWALGAGALFAAIAVYVGLPAAPRPSNAMSYQRIPAIVAPDILVFLMAGVFIALPFWARMGEPELWSDFGLLIHPAALITWPLAMIVVVILYFSARSASFWMVIGTDGLRVRSMWFDRELPFARIAHVEAYRWGLPAWVRLLAPLMAATGRYSAAGAVLLARDSHGLSIVMRDGTKTNIDADALEHVLKKAIAAMKRNGIRIGQDGERPGDDAGSNSQKP